MARRKSVFTEDLGKQIVLQVKIPEAIKERIDTINAQLKELDVNKTFSPQDILSDAIIDAVEQAEGELSRMSKKTQPKPAPRVQDEKKEADFA